MSTATTLNAESMTMIDTKSPEMIAAESKAADRELVREERRALAAIDAAPMAESMLRVSFQPQNMGEAMQLAALMADSNFVPGHMRKKAGDCMAIVIQAARWGMDPFAVANKSYFVKEGAPPAFEAQLVNAVVNSSGALSGRLRLQFEGEGEKLRCTVTGFLRADPNEPMVKTQSIARVSTRNSPLWKADPEQQLGYYTTRAWARLYCPEVLLGVYTPDEIEVQPERARNVSPPMPRRSEVADLSSSRIPTGNDEIDADLPAHDKETGEIAEPAGNPAALIVDAQWEEWLVAFHGKLEQRVEPTAIDVLWKNERAKTNGMPAAVLRRATGLVDARKHEIAAEDGK